MFPQANLLAWSSNKLNLTQKKQHSLQGMHQSEEMYYNTKQTQEKLKPGFVAFYDIWPGNGAGLFSKE